jgi:hypothetical protein
MQGRTPPLDYGFAVQAMTDLDRLEEDLDDVETALECLTRDSDELCGICRAARVDGSLNRRPALFACAETKLPHEAPLDLPSAAPADESPAVPMAPPVIVPTS